MKYSLGISNFLEEISSLSHSIISLYFFTLITEEGFLISPCYSLELCIQKDISFLFSFDFQGSWGKDYSSGAGGRHLHYTPNPKNVCPSLWLWLAWSFKRSFMHRITSSGGPSKLPQETSACEQNKSLLTYCFILLFPNQQSNTWWVALACSFLRWEL